MGFFPWRRFRIASRRERYSSIDTRSLNMPVAGWFLEIVMQNADATMGFDQVSRMREEINVPTNTYRPFSSPSRPDGAQTLPCPPFRFVSRACVDGLCRFAARAVAVLQQHSRSPWLGQGKTRRRPLLNPCGRPSHSQLQGPDSLHITVTGRRRARQWRRRHPRTGISAASPTRRGKVPRHAEHRGLNIASSTVGQAAVR